MRYQIIVLLACFLLFVSSLTAQSVTITGQKKVYTRAKPIVGFKKTFSIRRPIAKAATLALSRKITAAIDPATVLGIDTREELTEIQWLSEADYEEVFNEQGILTMMLWMEGSAAYSDGLTRYVVIDVESGNRLKPADVFTDIPGLVAAVRQKQNIEVEEAIKVIKADPDMASADGDPRQLFAETLFEEKDLANFAVDRAGVAFFYDYGFPNVIKALEPAGELRLSWSEVKPFIKPGSLLAPVVR